MFPSDDEAFQSDLYVERLLDTHRGAARPVELSAAPLDPELRETAELLERVLVRYHPSFRFEEVLAGRLRAAADVIATPAQIRGIAIPFPRVFPAAAVRSGDDDPHDALRGVLVGSAIASGVSLAGAAALLVWRRRSRPARLI
jgi:hypothetical protein